MADSIIIFTKDRPETLNKTLKTIVAGYYPIIVLDDSCFNGNRSSNQEICGRAGASYHGKEEQREFLNKKGLDNKRTAKFIHKLGARTWNLGFCRNYAIVLARSLHLKKLLFMDDDIIVESKELPAEMFALLDKYDFVGSGVTGMPDDSVIGYIVREMGQPPEEYFSGGFIALKPDLITEYFINRYNEDWIWLYLHQPYCSLVRHGEVKQQTYDQFKNAIRKARMQEIGEIIVDAVKEALEAQDFHALKTRSIWKKALKEKQPYFEKLKTISRDQNRPDLYKILTATADFSAKLDPNLFSAIFNDYFRQRPDWINLLNAM